METLVLDLQHVKKSYGNRVVLDIERLTAYENDRVAIIGSNGSGKTTLLRLINQEITPDSGTIQIETEFNYFAQINDVNELYRSNELDSELLSRLHVPTNQIETLSGGELNKYRLAQVLSVYKLGLLLDEPTTHLDMSSINYLIDELQCYYGTLIFVSHNRHFINQLATQIWEVDKGKVTVYRGNYDDYLHQKEAERLEQQNAFENYQKEKSRLEAAALKQQQQAEKQEKTTQKQKNRQIKPDRLSSSKQKDTVQKSLHKTSKAIEKRIEQLDTVQINDIQQQINFPYPKRLELHNHYPIMGEHVSLIKGDKLLLDDVHFQFQLEEKIAIIGDNGSGKSSLLHYILQEEEGITISPKAVIETYQQMAYQFASDQTVLSYLMANTDYQESFVRAVLKQIGFDESDIQKSVQYISGGEATRLALAELFIRPSNIIILDEPTNFIDVITIQALEQFIVSYPGTVIFTSHDRYFVNNVATQIYEIANHQIARVK